MIARSRTSAPQHLSALAPQHINASAPQLFSAPAPQRLSDSAPQLLSTRNLVQITHDCARPRLSASAPERLGASAPQRISASAPQRFSAPAQVAVVFLPDTIVDRGNAPRFGVRFVRKKRSFVIFGHKLSATLCTSALPRVPPKCDIDRQRGKPTAPPPPKYAKLRRRRGAQPATRRKLPCGAGMRSALQLGGRWVQWKSGVSIASGGRGGGTATCSLP